MKRFLLLFSSCTLLLCVAMAAAPPTPAYKLTGSIPLGGTGGWDYLTADSQNRRLYVSHSSQVEVLDLDTGKPVGQVTGMTRIHGIALDTHLGVGFISDGAANQIVEFDLKTLQVKNKIKAGSNPDGILYDGFSQRVFAFNGRSGNATVVDAATGSVAGTIELGGKPEFPVSDGKGNVFVNIEDKSEILKLNPKTMAVAATWPLAPCESPSGLAIDALRGHLFAVCDNKMMAVVDTHSGKVIATPVIGEGPDAAAFDPGSGLAFSSNGESGTLSLVRQTSKTEFSTVATVSTAQGARTMALDEKTHKLYLPTASFGPPQKASGSNAHPRPSILPGSFKLLVVSQ